MTDLTYFTSESVSEGHPDKMADQISDAILDALITDDKYTRAGIETMVKTGLVLVSGEVRTDTWVDIEDIIRQVVLDIGYDHSSLGFDGNTCAVLNGIGKQSQDMSSSGKVSGLSCVCFSICIVSRIEAGILSSGGFLISID